MFLTAHRVRRVAPMHQEGINVILRRHGTAMIPRDAMGYIDLHLVAGQQPGDMYGSDFEVAPGGNSVLSFLDVALDDVSCQDLSLVVGALQRFEHDLLESDSSPRPVSMIIGHDVAVHFSNYNRGVNTDLDEFRALRDRLLSVVHSGGARTQNNGTPLTVSVIVNNNGQVQMQLEPKAKQRLLSIHHGRFAPVGFLIDHSDWHDLITMHGREELINVVIVGLTGLSPEEVAALGGIDFIESGQTVLQWHRP